jgi:prephenate dehydrogenase
MTVGVIGTGLIGSSLIRSLTARGVVASVRVFDTNSAYVHQLSQLGLACVSYDSLIDLAEGCDLIFVCTPVNSIAPTICRLIPLVSPTTVITDVGSTKSAIIDEVTAAFPHFTRYVPGHPMGGGDASGPLSGREDLFAGRQYFLTPYTQTDAADVNLIAEIAKTMGAIPTQLNAIEHDKIVALISHLPHLYAFSLMHAVSDLSKALGFDVAQFAGAAFMDVTRIAAADTRMWMDIFDKNEHLIQNSHTAVLDHMEDFLGAMRDHDAGRVASLIEEARQMRIALGKSRNK